MGEQEIGAQSDTERSAEEKRAHALELATTIQLAQTAMGVIMMVFPENEIERLREAISVYKQETQGARVLADMFGRSAINDLDANAQVNMPVLEKFADLAEAVYERERKGPQRATGYGDEMFNKMFGGS